MPFTRREASEFAVVLITTHGRMPLKYHAIVDGETKTIDSPSANIIDFIDTLKIPATDEGDEVNIYKLTATSPGICNVTQVNKIVDLIHYIKSERGEIDLIRDPLEFTKRMGDFYGPRHKSTILDIYEGKGASNKRRKLSAHDMLIYEHGDLGLNIAHYKTGDIMIDKTFFRTGHEAEEGAGDDFAIKIFSSVDYDDMFDEIALPGENEGNDDDEDEDLYYTTMSMLLSHIISSIGKKNIIIVDLTCSTFEDKPVNPLITDRIQRRAGRRLVELGLWGGNNKRRFKTLKIKLTKRKLTKCKLTKRKRKIYKTLGIKKTGGRRSRKLKKNN